ncbi:MAG: hypothetical protein Q8908_08990 [Bacteroidota bacterium]|nr:hypothetical protein [Bacteroidota bacterium]
MEGVIISLAVFAMIYGIVHLNIRKKERLMLIQAGLDPATFEKNAKPALTTVKLGMVLIAVGLGVLLANIIVKFNWMDRDAAYFSLVFLFGGFSLLASYFLERKQIKDNQPEEEESNADQEEVKA